MSMLHELVGPRPEVAAAYVREGWWDGATVTSLLADALRTRPNTPVAVHSAVRPWNGTVGELAVAARRFAAGLHRAGVRPGDVVAFQLPNWAETLIVFYGSVLAGAVLLPIPHFYGLRELGHAMLETGARVLVVADRVGRRDHVAELDEWRASAPALDTVVVIGDGVPGWAVPFERLLEAEPLAEIGRIDPAATAAIAYTSGTGAAPKGILLSHRALAFEIRHHIPLYVRPARPLLMGLPMSHVGGMLLSGLHPTLTGSPLVVTDAWNPGEVLRRMVADGLSAGSGSTVFLTSLLDHPDFGPEHAELMGTAALGGAPVPRAVGERAARLGIGTVRVYGSTEHSTITCGLPTDPLEKRIATDGRPMPAVEMRLVDELGVPVPAGTPGEIQSRGPDLFSGYTNPGATASSLSADGWFSTGDVGVQDDEGYLTITDRIKDVIIRGGENVSAVEVEELLMDLTGVAEVAVVAGPDPRMGERVCAFLRLRPAAAPVGLDEVRRHLDRAGLATRKWPEEVRTVEEMPRTASGKIRKVDLRQRLRDGY